MKLKSLIDAERNTRELTKRYGKDHDFEIGYQKYYNFLITNFYHFISGLQNRNKKGNLVKNLKGIKFESPISSLAVDYLSTFIDSNNLGTTIYYTNENTVEITLGKISLKTLLTKFYEELQKLEYYMYSPDKMQKDLGFFVRKNKGWLEKKKMRNQMIEDVNSIKEDEETYNAYYDFLTTLYNTVSNYKKGQGWLKDQYGYLTNNIDLGEPHYITLTLIQDFLDFYDLGYYNPYTKIITFESTPTEIKTAYWQEMQRLEHLREPKKTLKPEQK